MSVEMLIAGNAVLQYKKLLEYALQYAKISYDKTGIIIWNVAILEKFFLRLTWQKVEIAPTFKLIFIVWPIIGEKFK